MTELSIQLALRMSRGNVRPARQITALLGTATVVIPCYRYGHYLPAAVAAALDQPGLDMRVIVVDDASPDGSGDVAVALARGDDRIEVIRHHTNRGHIQTYNDGLAAASGDWVALVSADDLLTPGSLSRAAALMRAEPRVGFVYGRARHFRGEPPQPRTEATHWITWPGASWLRARFRSGHNVIASPEVVMRTGLQREIGGYRRDLPHSGDLEMWMRAATVADVGYVVGADQALYRQHDANMHASVFGVGDPTAAIVDLRHRWEAFRAVAGRLSPSSLADSLEADARRSLAREAMAGAVASQARGFDAAVTESFMAFAGELDTGVRPLPRLCKLPYRGSNRARSTLRWWRLNRVGT